MSTATGARSITPMEPQVWTTAFVPTVATASRQT
jgi:hypothetical protein